MKPTSGPSLLSNAEVLQHISGPNFLFDSKVLWHLGSQYFLAPLTSVSKCIVVMNKY